MNKIFELFLEYWNSSPKIFNFTHGDFIKADILLLLIILGIRKLTDIISSVNNDINKNK